MGPEKVFKFQGRDVPGHQVDFEARAEVWSNYSLEDGTQLKLKTVLLEVIRLDEYNAAGDPIYMFSAHQIVSVTVPDELKKTQG